MTRARKLPDVQVLKKMRDGGMSLRDIADWVEAETGEVVTPGGVSAALSRAGHALPQVRYADLIPWRVRMGHQKHLYARMLRLEGRRRAGGSLSPTQLRSLDAFLADLADSGGVINYLPEREPGWFIAPRRPGIDTDLIRVPDDSLTVTP